MKRFSSSFGMTMIFHYKSYGFDFQMSGLPRITRLKLVETDKSFFLYTSELHLPTFY